MENDVKTVLIADDEIRMRRVIADYLAAKGYKTVEAANGSEAVLVCRRMPIDLVLLDVMMPQMDGYQATRAIRAMDRPDAATVPIIAMTANAFADDRQKAQEAGMNEHVTKPLESGLLLRTIKE